MVKRYIRPSTATADTAVRHLDNHDETVMHALVTAGAFVALADGRVQAIERDELVNFVDRQGFIPSISRHEIAEAFDNRVRQLQNGDSADVLAETLRPLAGLSLASVVIRTATKVAAADRYIHPGESRALQLIRLVLAAAQDPSKYVVTDELREAAGQESHGVWKPSKDVTAALTDVLRAGAPAPPAPEIQLIYETAPIGLAFLTPDCRYVLINHHMTEICGISVADHVGRSVRETVPQVADQVEEIVRTILRTRQPIVGIEINGQRPDGGNAQRCWITYWHPLKNKDGSIAGINVAAEEITERKRSEAALAVAEQRYRALVRATSSLVWTTSADGQVLDIPEWRTYTGQSVEQAKGWGWLAALHPDDREHTAVVWQKAVDTRSLFETEYRIRRSDGVYIWHKARGVAIIEDDKSIREWVGICLDIDVRKRATERQIEAEKALRDLNQWLEQRVEAEAQERSRIWNVSQDLLVVGDTKGRIISVNPAWAETLGWSEDELRLKSGEWLVHPNDLEKSQNEQISLVEGRNTRHFENRIRDKQGKYHVVSWRAVPDQGRIYAVGRDVTELRDAEEQLRASRRELARVSQQSAVGVATASIAHEINQPLAAIVANASAGLRWLDRPVPNIAEVRAVLERIVSDGHHMKEVISGIRAMFGKGRLERTVLNVNTLIEEVLALMRRELESQQVLLRTQMADGLPDVLVERVQLQQVLVNLITNAVDAMSSEPGRTRQLTITSELHNAREVRISVEDSGSGIDPSHTDQIFHAFFTTKPHGMGMGLSICRSIIEAHGGRLWAVPRSPHGTTFYVQLPRNGEARGPS